MSSRRIPVVESTAANGLSLLFHFLGVALVLAGESGWGLYCFGCGQVVFWGAVLHEHIHRTYPHEELS